MQRSLGIIVFLSVLAQLACAGNIDPRAPEDLISFIQSAEASEIRESWGEEAGQCFTWADYDVFVRAGRPVAVAAALKSTPAFQKLATMIGGMSPAQRDALLDRARATARPTWAMIGRISRDGTTDAGRKAGLLLASAITDAVEELLPRR
jgi:hypothetical protein